MIYVPGVGLQEQEPPPETVDEWVGHTKLFLCVVSIWCGSRNDQSQKELGYAAEKLLEKLREIRAREARRR